MTVSMIVVAYLLGSLSGSLLLGKWRGVDIRTQGSGNAGGTNALRTQGFRFALGTMVIDIGKGALVAWLALRWLPPSAQPWGVYACTMVAVIGHVWPLYHGFHGGKGAGTLVGALAVVWPGALPWILGVWLLTVLASGYVGLSTVLAAVALFVLALAKHVEPARLVFAGCAALFIVFTHRANLARLHAGTEARFERVHVLGRWTSRGNKP